ncbi:MAG: DUF2232 domain-containing protein [Bacillota bacterium]|nr:DUF2232 domain-containing protein [Bacillota bacterium]
MPEGRAMREAGTYALAVTGLLLAGLYLPFLHFLFGMALLVLTVVTARRQTAVLALIVLAACGGVLAVVFWSPDPMIMVLEFGFLGLVPALGFKNGAPPEFILAATLFAAPVFVGLGLALGWFGWGLNPMDATGVLNGPGAETPAAREAIRLAAVLLPGSYAVWAFATGLAGFFLSQEVLRQLGLAGQRTIPFSSWRLPWYAVWGLIAALTLVLAGDYWRQALWRTAGQNILFLMAFVYFTAGVSLAAHYYHRLNWARPWKLLAVALAVFYWPLTFTFLAMFGLSDSLVNLRERQPRPPQKEE